METDTGQRAYAENIQGLKFSSDQQDPFSSFGETPSPSPSSVPYKQKTVRRSKSSAGFLGLDFDLSKILGNVGEDVNENLLKNFANVTKIYFWIFTFGHIISCILWTVAIIRLAVTTSGIYIFALVIGFPVAFLLYFLMRIIIKTPIEFVKYVLETRHLLHEIRAELQEKK
ncbi:MAG: hypothetical protein Q4C96_06755 [Planctomycetia bacterium]|nr:hypothetical protein [Planctomycetia bacterium]